MQEEENSYKVYIHTFPNSKVYVGLTCKRLPCERWCGGHGYKNQPLMWKAIQKYGWKNVKHSVVRDGMTKAEAEALEIELISKYRANDRRYGYNIDNGGKCSGRMADETKKKISAAHSGAGNPFFGRHLSDEHKQKIRDTRKELEIQPVNKRPVRCLETGVVYESTAQATRELGIHNYAIRRVCYGERKTAGGYHWEYVTA